MTPGRARFALAGALLVAAAACRRGGAAYETPEPGARARDAAAGDAAQPAAVVPPARRGVFVQQVAPREVSALLQAGHAHPAVASLEAAGCDFALVMTGAAYDRLVALAPAPAKLKPIGDPAGAVVYCTSRTTTIPPPDCAALAPIFARVARPRRRFHVLSGFGVPPMLPGCSGVHDANGRLVAGDGPGYPPSR